MFVSNTTVTIISCQQHDIHSYQLDMNHLLMNPIKCEQHAIQNLLVAGFARSSKQEVTTPCLAPNLTLSSMPCFILNELASNLHRVCFKRLLKLLLTNPCLVRNCTYVTSSILNGFTLKLSEQGLFYEMIKKLGNMFFIIMPIILVSNLFTGHQAVEPAMLGFTPVSKSVVNNWGSWPSTGLGIPMH